MIGKVVVLIRKLIHNLHLRSISRFISVGNSHFTNNFRLTVIKPVNQKTYVTIEDGCMLDCKIVFESGAGLVKIGNNNYIGNSNIICRSSIIFDDNIFVAWGCYFYDHNSHSIDYIERENDIQQQLTDYRNKIFFIENKNWDVVDTDPIRICSNAWIGMNCIILKGVTVGQGAIVAAGSVVTKNVEPWTMVGGNPAKLIKIIPENLRKK